LDFQFPSTEFELAKNSNTNVTKAFFFIFMSSYAEMSFWGQKNRKNRVQQIFFLEMGRHGYKKNP
jgi:quinol-cytochrome oxidoreductase complex cytochrome b subunit